MKRFEISSSKTIGDFIDSLKRRRKHGLRMRKKKPRRHPEPFFRTNKNMKKKVKRRRFEVPEDDHQINLVGDERQSFCSFAEPIPGKPHYMARWNNEDWIKVNYDSGAGTTALPVAIAGEDCVLIE